MKLSVVLGTYNRLNQLQRCIDSIFQETQSSCKIYVTDAGSTDGTIEYLQKMAAENFIPIFVGERLGQAKAYNDVFSMVDTPYVCWLSDDNQVVNGGLDLALKILESNKEIGLVALKTKDQRGPFVNSPYIGGVSEAGILNVNQGVLPTSILRQVGGFSEEFRDYGIDSALTADILLMGHKVVYTKKIALHHFRNWSEDITSENYKWLQERHAIVKELYARKYTEGKPKIRGFHRFIVKVGMKVIKLAPKIALLKKLKRSAFMRTSYNIWATRYINILDPLLTLLNDYHLVQCIKLKK